MLGQVVPVVGAGEEKGWGPAPRIAVLCLVVAQVPPQNTYLRQSGPRPAPEKVLTCAVMAIDLRQELRLTERCPLSFAPWNLYRAVHSVISTERKRVEKSAGRSAKQAHGRGHSVRCAGGCGAPGADYGLWRTAVGQPGPPGGCRCAAVWRERGQWWGSSAKGGQSWERFPVKPGMRWGRQGWGGEARFGSGRKERGEGRN